MKGDFFRTAFDTAKHFIGVLMQQGRVQLDADGFPGQTEVEFALRGLGRSG